jgi:hypothetical protein
LLRKGLIMIERLLLFGATGYGIRTERRTSNPAAVEDKTR